MAYQDLVPGGGTSEHSDHGRYKTVFRVVNQSREVRTQTHSGVFVHVLQIPPILSPYKTHSKEMAQTSEIDSMLKVKACFDCKMFDVVNWVVCLNREDGPRGKPSYEALSVASQGTLEIFSVIGQPPSLVRDHFSSPRVVAKTVNVIKGTDLHPKDHNIQIFTEASNRG